MKRGLPSAAFVVLLAGLSHPVAAQGLSDKISQLIKFGNCDQSLCIVTGAGNHGSHFLNSAQVAGTDLLAVLTNAISSSVGSLPISSTSGGTTFSFVGGAPVRNTTSAGPIFAERASTLGQGRWLAGVNTTRISFTKLRGISTDSLEINLSHQDVPPPGLGDPAVEYDVVGIDLNLDLNLQVTTLFAMYGLTDRLDVGVAVPFVIASLSGTGHGRIFNPTGTVTGLHFFGTADAPSLTTSDNVDGNSAGVGDIALRGKLHLAGTNSRGLALLGDIRLPTGDKNNFQGAGSFAASALLLASSSYGNFSPHVNVGYAYRSGSSLNSSIETTVGFDHMINRSVTVAVDLLSQVQAGGSSGALPGVIPLPNHPVPGTNIPDQKNNPIGLSGGGRFLLGDFTVVANGLVPVKSGGLQASFMWTLGVERTF